MAITGTTAWGPNIPTEVIDQFVLSFLRSALVVTPMIRQVDIAGQAGLKHDFNSFATLSAAAKTQGTDFTPAALSISEDGTITAAEVGVAVDVSHIAREASPNVTDQDIAREIGNAVAEKMETDIMVSFGTATVGGGTTGVALAVTDFEDCLLALRQAKAPTAPQMNSNLPPALAGYFTVLSESGAAQLSRSIRQSGNALASPSQTQMLETLGAKAASASRFQFLGVNVFGSDLVPTSGGDRQGAMLCPAALGLVTKRPPRVKQETHEIGTSMYHVGSAVYGTGIIKTAFIRQILHLA